MKGMKRRITNMESRVIMSPPAVICATAHEDADRQLEGFRKQYGDHIRPVVLIAPVIMKTE